MKKNAVGRVLIRKEPVKRRISALHIPARLLCLALAVIIWLAVTNITTSAMEQNAHEQPTTEQAAI